VARDSEISEDDLQHHQRGLVTLDRVPPEQADRKESNMRSGDEGRGLANCYTEKEEFNGD